MGQQQSSGGFSANRMSNLALVAGVAAEVVAITDINCEYNVAKIILRKYDVFSKD